MIKHCSTWGGGGGGEGVYSLAYFQNVRDARETTSGGAGGTPPRNILKIRPPEIKSEPYVEQLCKQNHYKLIKCHLEFSPLIIVALRSAVN